MRCGGGAVAVPSSRSGTDPAVLLRMMYLCNATGLYATTTMPLTRSQRETAPVANQAAPAPQISQTTAQDSVVQLNWILFDKSHRLPLVIPIQRDLYEGPSQYCRPLFVQSLRKEYKVSAEAEDILFWKVGGTSFSRCIASDPL